MKRFKFILLFSFLFQLGFSQSDCCNYTLILQDSTSTSNPFVPGSVRLFVYNDIIFTRYYFFTILATIPGTNGGIFSTVLQCTYDSVQLADNGHMLNGLETLITGLSITQMVK